MLEEIALTADEERKFKPVVVALAAPRKGPQHKRFITLGGLVAAVLVTIDDKRFFEVKA